MTPAKKQNFKIALIYAGLSLRDFAEMNGVSSQAMDQVASGRASSKRLDGIISRFISSEFKKAGIVLNNKARGVGCAKNPMAVASRAKVSAPRLNS